MDEATKVLQDLQAKFPGTKIVKKNDSTLMKVINIFLMVITLGMMRTFMTSFVTTIGRTMYVPKDWDHRSVYARATTLRHEGIHLAQERRMGSIRYKLTYLFWVMPCLFAVGRRNLEQEAYAESMRARAEYFGLKTLRFKGYKEHMLSHFTSAQYFWIWPWKKQLNKWFDETLEQIEKDHKSR